MVHLKCYGLKVSPPSFTPELGNLKNRVYDHVYIFDMWSVKMLTLIKHKITLVNSDFRSIKSSFFPLKCSNHVEYKEGFSSKETRPFSKNKRVTVISRHFRKFDYVNELYELLE